MAKPNPKPKKKARPKREPHDGAKSVEPHDACNARTRQAGKLCTQPAGWGTDHVGQGRCKLHGGATPIKHGIYSAIQREGFQERLDRFRSLPDPLDLSDEIAILRAFLEDFIDRWEAVYGPDGAVMAWHESFNSEKRAPKPRQLPDFATLTTLVDRVGKMVQRVHKMKSEGAITLLTLNRVIEQMGADLVLAINEAGIPQSKSDKLLASIQERWNSIRLDAGTSGK